ncbi:MAG: DJ-1 family glyoxalase III [Verrucomicrobiota bacterium]|nr:DJ-1 family glyoxalase III [Verrucomicrobiota bacterium]
MKRVLIILAPGFEEIEGITVIDILRRAGAEVIVAGTIEGPIEASRKTRHLADVRIEAIDGVNFDMLVLPGGQPGADHLRNHPKVAELIHNLSQSGKWMAAICAAPSVLAAYGILDGKQFVCHPTSVDSLRGLEQPAGKAVYNSTERVIVDGQVVTSISAGSAMEFAFKLVEVLFGREKVTEVNVGVIAKL